MLIDWFTVAAQALNFLVLVWLLKRFLYKPILDAIDAREKRVANELAEAMASKSEAKKQSDGFASKITELDQQRAVLMAEATEKAKAERSRLMDEARKAAAELRTTCQESIRNETRTLHEAISRRTRQEVFAIARKTLSDLAGMSLEDRMVSVFVERLHQLSEEEKTGFMTALTDGSGPVLLRTTFTLKDEQRSVVAEAINQFAGMEIQVQFETDPELISGVELTTRDLKVAWSIKEYLLSLEQGIEELLKGKEDSVEKTDLPPKETGSVDNPGPDTKST